MAGTHKLMRCRACGVPRMVSFFIKWNDNGTVTQMMRHDFRVVLLHFGFIDNLFSNIEAKLGISIEHIAFEAQRNASKATFDAFYDRIPGFAKFLTHIAALKRIGVEGFHRVAVVTGQCHSETIEYRPCQLGVARITNPFYMPLMAANVLGAFEVLDQTPYDASWEETGKDQYVITIKATGAQPEIAERMALQFEPSLPGNLHLARCPRCGAPRALCHLKWMENDGIILDTRTGSRVVMLDGYMVTTVFREMARELGEEINDLLVDAQREWTVEHVGQLGLASNNGPLSRDKLEAAYREYLSMLPLFGQGNPVSLEMHDSRIEVTVENAYQPFLLAGTLQGLYEALEKAKSAVEWKETRRGAVTYTVRAEAAPSE